MSISDVGTLSNFSPFVSKVRLLPIKNNTIFSTAGSLKKYMYINIFCAFSSIFFLDK